MKKSKGMSHSLGTAKEFNKETVEAHTHKEPQTISQKGEATCAKHLTRQQLLRLMPQQRQPQLQRSWRRLHPQHGTLQHGSKNSHLLQMQRTFWDIHLNEVSDGCDS